jgi:hypothetical protein
VAVAFYAAGFDVAELSGLGTLTMATAGKTSNVVTLSSVQGNVVTTSAVTSLFFHLHSVTTAGYFVDVHGENLGNMLPDWSVICYAQALQGALRALATTHSWVNPTHINCSISSTTGKITIAYADATFSLTWTTAAGRDFLGFAADQSGGTTYTGTQTPMYLIEPSLKKVSRVSYFNEAENIATHVAPDDGRSRGFGMSRPRGLWNVDFVQEFETKEKSRLLSAQASHPFTFDHLKQHCRGQYPFLVYGGFPPETVLLSGSRVSADTLVFMNRTEGTRISGERQNGDSDVQFHHHFKTQLIAAYYRN